MNQPSKPKASPAIMIGILAVLIVGIAAIEGLSGPYYAAALVAFYVLVMLGIAQAIRDCLGLAQTDEQKLSLKIIVFWLFLTVLVFAAQLKPIFVSEDKDYERFFATNFGMCLALLTALKLVKTILTTPHPSNGSESNPDDA